MPNGTSDHFALKKSALLSILEPMEDEGIVGSRLEEIESASTPRVIPVSVKELKYMTREHLDDTIQVNEQDHTWYIVILELPNWISVDATSPLYGELRACRRKQHADLIRELRKEKRLRGAEGGI